MVDLDGNDPRLSDYRRRVMSKIHPLWANAFPQSAALEGRQGRVIVALTIGKDGNVSGVSIARTSGVPEFDENVRKAVLKAAPFPPLPPELSARSMRWAISFDARNPVVRLSPPRRVCVRGVRSRRAPKRLGPPPVAHAALTPRFGTRTNDGA